jgi:hypothetical protein
VDIFQLDWVLIDSVIILLLVFLLIAVRLFKQFSRWRLSPSNLNLTVKRIPIEDVVKNLHLKKLQIERCDLLFNSEGKDDFSKSIIVFLSSNFYPELLNVLSEGLASCGFNVVQLRLRINSDLKDIIRSRTAEKQMQNECYVCLSTFLKYITQNYGLEDKKYFIAKFGKSALPYNALLDDPHNKGIILLNPRNTAILRSFSSMNSTKSRNKLLLLFSYIPYLMFKYKLSTDQFNVVSNKVSVIKGAFYSFKHYETVLLGLILRFINRRTKKT